MWKKHNKTNSISLLIYGLPLPLMLFSLSIGSASEVTSADFWRWLWNMASQTEDGKSAMVKNIIEQVRMPRVLLTFLVGAALATSGNTLQAIFRNPLADSYVLGISSGAAFGAALAINSGTVPLNLTAFIFGLLAVCLAFYFGKSKDSNSMVTIVLSGMIVTGLFTAGLTVIQYMSDPYKLQAIVQWTMGNLHQASWLKLQHAYIPLCLSLGLIYLFRWKLNILALGDDEAKSVGVNPLIWKYGMVALATICTSSSVAAAGIISMYGLFVPHIVRILVGPNNSKAIPANMLVGGSLLLCIDNISRTLLAFEIPIGIFTMILGAPVFIFLMRKNKVNWT